MGYADGAFDEIQHTRGTMAGAHDPESPSAPSFPGPSAEIRNWIPNPDQPLESYPEYHENHTNTGIDLEMHTEGQGVIPVLLYTCKRASRIDLTGCI